MFNEYYPFVFRGIHKEKKQLVKNIYRYRFKAKNETYIVNVEEYDNSIFIIKFYPKKHRLSENKYSLRTNKYLASRIFATCLKIGKDIQKNNDLASFGFIGANDLGEGKDNTKRYRVYKKIVKEFFSSENYYHVRSDENSLYLILNKQNKNIDKNKIINTIAENFEIIL